MKTEVYQQALERGGFPPREDGVCKMITCKMPEHSSNIKEPEYFEDSDRQKNGN